MAKPHRLREIEQEHGELEQVIPKLVNKLGSQKAAADKLGLSQATISTWLRDNGYEPQTIYIRTDKQKGEKAS